LETTPLEEHSDTHVGIEIDSTSRRVVFAC